MLESLSDSSQISQLLSGKDEIRTQISVTLEVLVFIITVPPIAS